MRSSTRLVFFYVLLTASESVHLQSAKPGLLEKGLWREEGLQGMRIGPDDQRTADRTVSMLLRNSLKNQEVARLTKTYMPARFVGLVAHKR